MVTTTEMTVRDRAVRLVESIGENPQDVNTADWKAVVMVARRTLDVTDEYFDLVVGASLDWQANQYRYHTGKLHEHSSHEVKKAVIGTIGSWQHGPERFTQAVNT